MATEELALQSSMGGVEREGEGEGRHQRVS